MRCHGFSTGAFEDSEDDGGAVVEELFPEGSGEGADAAGGHADAQTNEVSNSSIRTHSSV